MKNKISFLAIIAAVLGANYVNASECVDDDCEIEMPEPVVFEQEVTETDIYEEHEPLQPLDIAAPTETVEPVEPIQTIQLIQQPEPVQQTPIMVSTPVEYETCEYDTSQLYTYRSSCPFHTESECAIWRKKPVHKTALFPRAPHFSEFRIEDILYAIYENYNIDANDPAMYPLLERYNILMRASNACCGAGIIYKMRANGASDKQIYQFLKDDANYFAVMKRCMVMNDDEFDSSYSNGVTGKMAIEVRNACLCKNRQWFETLLNPFFDVYYRAPMFEDMPFAYTYIDDMQREVTVYINDEVHTTMGLLNACPK